VNLLNFGLETEFVAGAKLGRVVVDVLKGNCLHRINSLGVVIWRDYQAETVGFSLATNRFDVS
jgi:hypothetical protein